jgi:hypothetical protein
MAMRDGDENLHHGDPPPRRSKAEPFEERPLPAEPLSAVGLALQPGQPPLRGVHRLPPLQLLAMTGITRRLAAVFCARTRLAAGRARPELLVGEVR